MPAVITHHLFGCSLLADTAQEGAAMQAIRTYDERCAFLLGNQGPDPLFYLCVCPRLARTAALGGAMHDALVPETMQAMRDAADALDGPSRDVAWAYLRGYLAHHALDSTAHPFIYAWQDAVIGAGVAGLTGKDAAGCVHSQIETDLDAALLSRVLGETIATWPVHEHALQASPFVLKAVGTLYQAAAPLHGFAIDEDAWAHAVRSFRLVARVLHSPTGRARAAVGRAERLVREHSRGQALSHRTDVGDMSEWENETHSAWVNRYTKAQSTASFNDLLNEARDVWARHLARLSEGASFMDLVTLNFEGDPIK